MRTTSTTVTRSAAQQVYRYVVNNWAVTTSEVADEFTGLANTTAILRQLAKRGLVASTHVNEEKALTWQSHFDIENEPMVPARAGRAFAKAWPVAEDTVASTNGNTGSSTPRPKYTEDQLAKARAAKAKGLTRKQVAAAAGIRSPNYLAKLLKREALAAAKAKRSRKAQPAAKRTRKPRSKVAA